MDFKRVVLVREQRLATCQTCDQKKPLTFGFEGCRLWDCPCPITSKTWLMGSKCPANKWAE